MTNRWMVYGLMLFGGPAWAGQLSAVGLSDVDLQDIPGDYCGVELDESGHVLVDAFGEIQDAVVAEWPEVNGTVTVTYLLDPDMPDEAKAAFRRAALQVSNVAGSAIAGGTNLTLVEVSGDFSSIDTCRIGQDVWRANPAPYGANDPNPADEIADLVVVWQDDLLPSDELTCTPTGDDPGSWFRLRLGTAVLNAKLGAPSDTLAFVETNQPGLYDYDPATGQCLRMGGGLMAINGAFLLWNYGTDMLPTYLTGSGGENFEYTMLHELMHFVLGTTHQDPAGSSLLPVGLQSYANQINDDGTAPAITNAFAPHGGDPGGASDYFAIPDVEGSVRLGPAGYRLLSDRYPGTGDFVGNVVLYKWNRSMPGFVEEIWTSDDPDPGSFWSQSAANEFVDFPDLNPPIRLPEIGYVGASGTSAEVRLLWYLIESGQTCTSGYPLTWLEDSGVPFSGEPTQWYGRSEFTIQSGTREPVLPPRGLAFCTQYLYSPIPIREIAEGGDYRLCATVERTDGGGESTLEDNTIYSDRPVQISGQGPFQCGSIDYRVE